MSSPPIPQPGTVSWFDLTVDNAEEIRDFYAAVVGWRPDDVAMGDYNDYSMATPESGESIAGVCHARGSNAALPHQWLIYITVEDLDRSIQQCLNHKGSIVVEPRTLGSGRFCVIRDPAGAVAALYAPAQETSL